jgi:hypothetical protein
MRAPHLGQKLEASISGAQHLASSVKLPLFRLKGSSGSGGFSHFPQTHHQLFGPFLQNIGHLATRLQSLSR